LDDDALQNRMSGSHALGLQRLADVRDSLERETPEVSDRDLTLPDPAFG